MGFNVTKGFREKGVMGYWRVLHKKWTITCIHVGVCMGSMRCCQLVSCISRIVMFVPQWEAKI